ncbi:MAG: type II secretion system protein GspG [Planctomycetes bacterium]|nr:type II secretion system protein GspG [Planctomycetota bacterium]
MCELHKQVKEVAQRGFTLVEIMVVVVIIGLLVSLVGPAVLGRQADAQIEAAKSDIANIAQTVELYMLKNGQRIPEMQDLLEKDEHGQPWIRGGNIEDGQFVDPWKTPYEIHQLEGLNFDIISAGPDREMDTDDDIRYAKDEE